VAEDTQIVFVEGENGDEPYAIEALLDADWLGESRQYALMMAVKADKKGRRGGILCRYHADAPDEEALEPVIDPLEVSFLVERVKLYFREKGIEIDL
jgi:hypothetical protein